MDYEKNLKKALKNIPEKGKEKKRFEVPRLRGDVQGNRTYVKNFIEVAKKIRRDPKHIAKFLYGELAAPGQIDGKQLILQRKVYNRMLNERFSDYVKRFVLCPECGKPDTRLKKKDRLWVLECEACGARKSVA